MKKFLVLFLALLFVGGVVIFGGFIPVGMRHVPLAVTFKLTDPNYHPLPGVPIRLVFACDPDWQKPDAGYRFVTDAKGEGHVTAPVVLDRRWRKMDSSFLGSLLGLPMLTDHLAAGAEMGYMTYHWVYIVDTVLYPEGTTAQDNFSVYTRGADGNFSDQAQETSDNDWIIKDLHGQIISSPGFEPWDYQLDHDDSGQNWTLKLAFKKFPPAMQR